jgi:TatD DNase family protein
VIDTHCHLTFPDFQAPKLPGGVAGVLSRANAHGVSGCITIATTTHDCLEALAVAKQHENVWCTAGVHPLYADEAPHAWHNLRIVASDRKCVAWGELGLDNHYSDPPCAIQDRVLEEQLAFIASCQREGIRKPIVVHCREAFVDLIPRLRASGLDMTRMVFHCFTGTPEDMRMLLETGAMVSFTGVTTYRNAPALREAVLLAPIERIMIETDAPFLSPHPHRGVRPCEPWMASVTARTIAEMRGVPWDDFHAQINANTTRFFGIVAR